jgi:hypothetical protein
MTYPPRAGTGLKIQATFLNELRPFRKRGCDELARESSLVEYHGAGHEPFSSIA